MNRKPQTTIQRKPGRKKKKVPSPKQDKFLETWAMTGSKKQALKEAGYSPTARPENFQVVKDAMADRQKEMRKKFLDDAEEMRSNILDIARNAKSDAVRLQAAKDILDRAGLNPITKSQNESAKYVSIENRITRDALNRYENELQKITQKKEGGE